MANSANEQSTLRRPTTGMLRGVKQRPDLRDAECALQSGDALLACNLFEQLLSSPNSNDRLKGTDDIYSNYSAALFLAGRFRDAEEAALQATSLIPESAEAWCNLGTARQAQGRVEIAVDAYRVALELAPDHSDTQINLALACEQLGDPQAAIELLSWVTKRERDNPAANFELGRILAALHRTSDALLYLERAQQQAPNDADCANMIGVALRQLGQEHDAVRQFERAASLSPDSPIAFSNLSRVYKDLGRLDAAVVVGRKALQLGRQMPEALNNLASALRSQGCVEEAIELFSLAAEKSNDSTPASNRLCAEQYVPGVTRRRLLDLHKNWAERFTSKSFTTSGWRSDVSGRHLRIGFVSPDLGHHPIGYFLSGLLSHLRESAVDSICYSDRKVGDSLTDVLKSRSTHWREVSGVSNEQLAEQVSADGVDVLIDLAGHTAANRLALFANRVAPVQATWLGYVGTTGVSTIDYLIADRHHVPTGEEGDYVESIARLPDGYLCFEPQHAPQVNSLPALSNGYVTFGAFHNPAKVNADSLTMWSRILAAVPGARLVLKYWGFDSREVQRRVLHEFERCNVDSERIEFRGASEHAEHLKAFHDVDILLDSRPYSGGLTTCESLWMGVPVVTCPGETFAGRHSASHLTNAGFEQLVCDSEDQYVDVAVSMTRDLSDLAEMRQTMRSQVAASPLCDTKRFAANFAELMRRLCESSCTLSR